MQLNTLQGTANPVVNVGRGNAVGSWMLVTISWDQREQTATLHVASSAFEGPTVRSVSQTIPRGLPPAATFEPRSSTQTPLVGAVGCWAIRPRRMTAADAHEMYATAPGLRDPQSPINHQDGWNESGIIAGYYGVAQLPAEISNTSDPDYVPRNLGRRIGSPVDSGDLLIYKYGGGVANSGSLITPRAVMIVGEPKYRFESDSTWSFRTASPEPAVAEANSEGLARWAFAQPESPVIIATCGNSRNVRQFSYPSTDALDDVPHGFAASQHAAMLLHRRELCGGNMNVLIHLGTGRRQPGFEGDAAPVTSGQVETVAGDSHFSRAFWNSVNGNGAGPGQPVSLAHDAEITLYADPISDSRFLGPDDPWHLSVTFLKYPGAPGVSVRAVESSSKSGPGTPAGGTLTFDADTTRATHLFDSAADALDQEALVLSLGDPSAAEVLEPGDLIYNVDQNSLAEVALVDRDGIALRHAFETPPQHGDLLRFGPLGYGMAEVGNPPTGEPHRGIRVSAGRGEGLGPVLLGGQSLRTAREGAWFQFVQTGWGGNGVVPQMNESFARTIPLLLELYEARFAIVFDPYQGSSPFSQSFPQFGALLQEASTIEEVTFLVGQTNSVAGGQETGYHNWAINQSEFPAISITGSPMIGDQRAQLNYGGVQNISHPATECFQRVMQAVEALAGEAYVVPGAE